MSTPFAFFRAAFLRFANLFRKQKLDRELSDELQGHLQLHIDDNLRAGITPAEARRLALLKLGGLQNTTEAVRDFRGFPWIESIFQDLRFSFRMLLKSPGFVSIVVLSLALGIGANTTIFSVMNALLYRPLPYPHAERMVAIWEIPLGQPEQGQPPPIAEILDWQKQNHVFEDIALWSGTEDSVFAGAHGSEPVEIQDVTPNFFSLLNAQPLRGRIFAPDEMQEFTQTIVISYAFWKSHFNGDPDVLGKTFANHNTGIASTVVGIMPEGFAPLYGERVDLWQPINPASPRYTARQDHWLLPIAMLKQGVGLAQAQNEMDVIAHRLEQAYPETNKGIGKRLEPLHEALFGWARRPLYPLFGAVAFVLLIGCANVANLLQSRTETRRGEYAVRVSLGANRRRLMQQMFAESCVLALLGGVSGILLAHWGIQIFRSLAGSFPGSQNINIDSRVLLFTLAISLLTAFVFGLIPALQASRPDPNEALREGQRRTSAGSRSLSLHALTVCEVALAMVLLIGAGLTINSVLRLQQVDPGFDYHNLLTLQIHLPEGGDYMQRVPGGDMEKATPRVSAFYQQLLERVGALPGVESVGSITGLPMHFSESYSFVVQGHPTTSPDQRPRAGYNEVTPGFFRTLKIPLKKGRYLDEHDTATAPWSVVVNESFVRRYLPNEDPIGKQILLRYDPYPVDQNRFREIVGVVGDVKHRGLQQPAPPFIYASHFQQPEVYPGGAIVAHLWQELAIRPGPGVAPESLAAPIRKVVTDLDPDQAITNVMTMDQILADSLAGTKFYRNLLGIFASVAVLMALMGIYGVLSYFVNQRTREIGIRVALGANPFNVVRLVTELGLKLAVLGVIIGTILALILVRAIASILFGVKPADPTTYAAVAVALLAVAFLACFFPARRATKVDPMVALRYE